MTAIPKQSVKYTGKDYTEFRRKVLVFDKYTCVFCLVRFQDNELSLHHKLRRSRLRLDTIENCYTCCLACHIKLDDGMAVDFDSIDRTTGRDKWINKNQGQ